MDMIVLFSGTELQLHENFMQIFVEDIVVLRNFREEYLPNIIFNNLVGNAYLV